MFSGLHYTTWPGGTLNDWMYREDVAHVATCPSFDVRIECSMSNVQDYTESPPIGVIVHEARVVTRAPS